MGLSLLIEKIRVLILGKEKPSGVLIQEQLKQIAKPIERALQIQQERADIKRSLHAHYESIIERMGKWDYYPSETDEMIRTPSARYVVYGEPPVDVDRILLNLEKDKMHLREFPEVWKIYCDGPKVYSNYARANEVSITLVKSYLGTSLEKSGLRFQNWDTNRLVEEFADKIIGRVDSELRRGTSNDPFRVEQSPNEQPHIAGSYLQADFSNAKQLADMLNTIKKMQDVRERIGKRRKACDEVLKNNNGFLKSLKEKVIEPARNSDYTNPRLCRGVCDDCEHLKDRLALLTGA